MRSTSRHLCMRRSFVGKQLLQRWQTKIFPLKEYVVSKCATIVGKNCDDG